MYKCALNWLDVTAGWKRRDRKIKNTPEVLDVWWVL
jgi:hypothetical protein